MTRKEWDIKGDFGEILVWVQFCYSDEDGLERQFLLQNSVLKQNSNTKNDMTYTTGHQRCISYSKINLNNSLHSLLQTWKGLLMKFEERNL